MLASFPCENKIRFAYHSRRVLQKTSNRGRRKDQPAAGAANALTLDQRALRFDPRGGHYVFQGTGTVWPVLGGEFAQDLASARGLIPFTVVGSVG